MAQALKGILHYLPPRDHARVGFASRLISQNTAWNDLKVRERQRRILRRAAQSQDFAARSQNDDTLDADILHFLGHHNVLDDDLLDLLRNWPFGMTMRLAFEAAILRRTRRAERESADRSAARVMPSSSAD